MSENLDGRKLTHNTVFQYQTIRTYCIGYEALGENKEIREPLRVDPKMEGDELLEQQDVTFPGQLEIWSD